MPEAITAALPEEEFAVLVDALAADATQRQRLVDLLREDQPLYDQRGAATVVQMRGWVLLALARAGVSDDSLLFVLEELDTGVDPYLVAAAARALRSFPQAGAGAGAVPHARDREDSLSRRSGLLPRLRRLRRRVECTSPVRELLESLAWLGPHAIAVLPELEALAQSRRVVEEGES